MDLVTFFIRVRRTVHRTAAPLSAIAIAAHIARGGFSGPDRRVMDFALIAFTLLGLGLRLRTPRARTVDAAPLDLGVALLAVSLSGALVAAVGGVHGPLAALPLLVVAGGVALGDPRRVWVVVVAGALQVVALHHAAFGWSEGRDLGLRVLLLAAGALVHHGLTRVEVARVRAHAKTLLSEERIRQREAARSFRLAAPAAVQTSRRTERDDEARVRSSLEEIHASLVGLLSLARRTMDLRTCALFWSDAKGKTLRLVEAATDDADIETDPISSGAGALGAAVSLGRTVALAHLRPDYTGLPYYRGAHGVRAFAGVPIVDEGAVRGVLVADRVADRAFTAEEQATLESVALQARRLIDNERVFSRLERARNELAALFEASRALGEALTEDQCLAALATSARAIVEHDLLVFATYDERTREHRVRHVQGECAKELATLHFEDNTGIASAVVKARQALPYKGAFDAKTQHVFTRAVPLPDVGSVLVLPLLVRDRVMGTLTLCAHRRSAFPEGVRKLLGVLASHASVALANAAAVRRLEELATTDTMTGHLNKRALETEFDQRIRAAERFGRPLSVIVLDIDKFKTVNDTYGHATGDVVIKGLGAVLSRCRRNTDAIGRFGGEEFVIVCEETDTRGAFQLAERIREELGREVFPSEIGSLSVTCSLGISEFPRDGATRQTLFERADQALYAAKHNGRNQTRTASPVDGAEAPARHKPVREPRGARKTAAPTGRATVTGSG